MLRETWNWIVGVIYIILVAVIWIAASFVVQSVVDSGISPFLISYICNSLFVVYIPLVELSECLTVFIRKWFKGATFMQQSELDGKEKENLLGQMAVVSEVNVQSKVFLADGEITAGEEASPDSGRPMDGPLDAENNIGETRKTKRKWTRKEIAALSAIICPVWFLAQFTFNLSLKYTTVTSNTILSSTSSLFTFLVSLLFLGERFTYVKLLSVILCMVGTIIVAFGDTNNKKTDVAPRPILGDLICLLSALFYATYTTLIRKKFPKDEDNEEVSTALFLGYVGLFNALLFFPIILILHFTRVEPFHRLSPKQFGIIIAKGLFDNVVSDYLWAKSVLLTTPTVATAGLTLQVPIAAIVDSVQGRTPGLPNILGALAVLAGFFGINQSNSCDRCTNLENEDQTLTGQDSPKLEADGR